MKWAKGLTDDAWAAALAGGDSRCPPMPSKEIQEMFVGSSGIASFSEANSFWRYTQKAMANDNQFLNEKSRVLDIGVGWGRLYRWALRDLSPSQIVGIDVDEEAIKMCREAMPYGDFRYIPTGAPYPTEEGKFDLAFLFSIFSHLSEASAKSVLKDIHGALKPKGFLALTTLRTAHIDRWDSLKLTSEFYAECLNKCNFERTEWWDLAAEGHHLYVPTGGGGPSRPEDSYGEAVVPKGWWEKVEGFKLVEFTRYPNMAQAYVVLQKLG